MLRAFALQIFVVTYRYRGYYMAAWGYEFYLRVLKVSLIHSSSLKWAKLTRERYFQHSKIKFVSLSGHVMFFLFYRYWWNSYIKDNFFFISKEPTARLNGKLSCNWLIMLVTMATPISSHVKDKDGIFTARDEDLIFY